MTPRKRIKPGFWGISEKQSHAAIAREVLEKHGGKRTALELDATYGSYLECWDLAPWRDDTLWFRSSQRVLLQIWKCDGGCQIFLAANFTAPHLEGYLSGPPRLADMQIEHLSQVEQKEAA